MRRLTAVIFLFALCAQAHQFSGVDYIIQKAIGDHHTPGATVIIGTSEQILYHQAYGHFTYNASSTVVDTAHMFDLASLTKVIATTSCIMKLVDSGQLSIEDSVVSYIPAFGQNHKAGVRIKHCLLHTSGLPAYYSPSSSQSPEQILAAIYARSLQNPIGSTYLYSCLNFVTLMKVVEAVTGQAMWEYYRDQFTDPLGMERTLFCPPDSLHDECLPTSSVTGYRGVVHDPLARGLDGLSGNAGLFSTTADIAKLCQLLLNKGEYDDQRLLSEATVNQFTTRYNASTSRALGWGTNAYGSSSAGSLLSPQAIGHTGYTGTSVWCDPVKDIFIVLLTNRVYPNDTASITSTRAAVADAAVRAVEGIPPQPVLKYIRYGENSHLELAWEPNLAMGAVDATEIWLDFGSGFQLEQTVPPDTTRLSLALDAFPPDSTISTKIVNVYDSQPSSPSDIYAVRGSQKQLLIVDGYDRIGSWGAASHHFATVHAKALPDTVRFQSCSNEEVRNGACDLNDFRYVLWILADESTSNETFDSQEQKKVRDYLKNGGCLFVSGSEIGWDLSYKGSNSDKSFYHYILKASFSGDDSGSLSVTGRTGSIFEGLSFSYGTASALYPEDYPDYISALGGAQICLKYANGRNAALYYEGVFDYSTQSGKLVYLAFPFETIIGAANRLLLMERVIEFFQSATTAIEPHEKPPRAQEFALFPSYPNPFNGMTAIPFYVPQPAVVRLSILDLRGALVRTLTRKPYAAGYHTVTWDGLDRRQQAVASGSYLVQLCSTENGSRSRRITLAK